MRNLGEVYLASVLTLVWAAAPAAAQEAPPPLPPPAPATIATDTSAQGGIEEIVVTAQKRKENLQDVPISIAAVTGAKVADLHAATLQGLQGAVPNISIGNFSNTPNTAVVAIRGIGVIEPDPYAGNTVGIVVDDVPQYFSMGALLDLYDVDRIEVLRGPQGTLFGANTTGGVVSVFNKRPDDQLGGNFDLSYGNYKHLTVGGVINAPLADGLSARIAVNHDQRDGWVTNVVDGKPMGDRNVTLFRGSLRYHSGNFDGVLTGEYDRARNGSPIVVAGDLPGEAEFVPAGFRSMYVSPCLPAGSRCVAPDHYYSAQDGGYNGDTPDLSNMNTYRAGLTMTLGNTAIGNITSITGYKKFNLFEFTDQDGSPVQLIDTRRGTKGRQFSQELRTDFKIGSSVRVTVGGFYLGDHYDHYQDLRINFAGGATYNLATGAVTLGLPGLYQLNRQDQDNHSISGFAQTYIDVTNRLRAQAGIRYSHEKTSMLASTLTSLATGGVSTYDGTAPDGTPNLVLGNVAPPRGTKSWNNVGWKLGLDYKLTDRTLLYGYWARGFKSGGFTGRIGIAQDLGPYSPEKVDTFEAGFKTEFLDRHVRLNVAAFQTNYRDIQLAQIYFAGSGATLVQGNTILNAAQSRIRGFEGELTVKPLEGLTLSASLAYLSAKYRKFNFLLPSGSTLDLSGKRMQNAPKWSSSVGFNYEIPVRGDMAIRLSASYDYTSEKLLTSIVDTPRARVQPQHLVNANAELRINRRLTVGVFATNLFDNRYINSVFDSPGTIGLTNYAPPRQFGVSLKAKY